jgi:hypothetical protein
MLKLCKKAPIVIMALLTSAVSHSTPLCNSISTSTFASIQASKLQLNANTNNGGDSHYGHFALTIMTPKHNALSTGNSHSIVPINPHIQPIYCADCWMMDAKTARAHFLQKASSNL